MKKLLTLLSLFFLFASGLKSAEIGKESKEMAEPKALEDWSKSSRDTYGRESALIENHPHTSRFLESALISRKTKLPPDIFPLLLNFCTTTTFNLNQICKAHKTPIKNIIELKNGDLASYANSKEIKIWRKRDGKLECIQILNESASDLEWINSLKQLNNESLVSCSNNGIIRIWSKIATGWMLTQNLSIHSSRDSIEVYLIEQNDHKLLSYSTDGKIIEWQYILNRWVPIQIMNLNLLPGANKFSVKILRNGQKVFIVNNRLLISLEDRIQGFRHDDLWINSVIELKNGNLVCSDGIKIWLYIYNNEDHRWSRREIFFNGGEPISCIFELNNGDLALGYTSGRLDIWRFNSDNELGNMQMLLPHNKKSIKSIIQLKDGKLLSYDEDTIIIWKQTKSDNKWEPHQVLKVNNINSVTELSDKSLVIGSCDNDDFVIKIFKTSFDIKEHKTLIQKFYKLMRDNKFIVMGALLLLRYNKEFFKYVLFNKPFLITSIASFFALRYYARII